MERKFDVYHRESGRQANDAWVLIPSRDLAGWIAARVYASLCEPAVGMELRQTLQETYEKGIVMGDQGRRNDPHVRGGKLALRAFLVALEAIKNGRGEMIERVIAGITERLLPKTEDDAASAEIDDHLIDRIRDRLQMFRAGETVTVEHVARIMDTRDLRTVDSVLRGLADRHELVERFGPMTYRRR